MEVNNEPIFAKLNVRAFELGMDALKKLDKIEQIIKDDTYYEEYGNNAEKFIVSAISEVVENGNDK